MRTSWKGQAATSESGQSLLLVTIRQEHELIVSAQQIEVFLTQLLNLVENQTVSRDVAFAWQMEFDAMKVLLKRLRETTQVQTDVTLETPWQTLPSADWQPILAALKAAFASGVTVNITGSAPVFEVHYRFGTFLLSRPLDMPSIDQTLTMLNALKAVPEGVFSTTLDDIADNRISALDALTRLTGGTSLAGHALGGLAIGLAIAAVQHRSPAPSPVDQGSVEPALPVYLLAFGYLLDKLSSAAERAASAYRHYQEAERAKAERDRIRYELERERMRDQQRQTRPVRDTTVGVGGPAYERDIERAGRTC